MRYSNLFSESQQWQIIDDYINNYLSYREICLKYNIKSKDFIKRLLGNNSRSISEANKIAHIKYPERFFHTEETKAKIRNARLNYMKHHPNNTAWRLSNYSYPEKLFSIFLEKYKYTKSYKIIREYSLFPYFIDFAFVDQKLAIEIDGSQHLLPDRKLKDLKKDSFLLSKGWKVIRITENLVKTNWDIINSELQKCLEDCSLSKKIVGVFSYKRNKYQKKARGSDGFTDLQHKYIEYEKSKSKCPDRSILESLSKHKTAKEISKIYNVSDRTVGNWFSKFKIPHKTRGGKLKTY